MAYEQIKYEVEDHVLTITLNRPDKMNAFTHIMMDELIAAFDAADADDNVRAIIVTGAGRAFCAGADLSEGGKTFDRAARADRKTAPLRPNGEIEWSDDAVRDGGGRVTLRIFKCLKPVIGAINGAAVGIGVTMQLPMGHPHRLGRCAVRLRVRAARHRAGSRIELVPAAHRRHLAGAGVVLLRPCVPAQEALAGRLVSKVVPADELMTTARALAREIADNSAPVSLALIRQQMWRMLGADDPMEAHKVDSRGIYSRGQSADVREGVMSFLEKRPAKFTQTVSKDMPSYFPWWTEREYK